MSQQAAAKNKNRDLTVGKPRRVLWRFCLPLLGSVIFQQLYNVADSLVAGKFIGENALAAVGNSYEITLIFISFALGCNAGCSVVVSQLFGAKRMEETKCAAYTSLIASASVCAVLMVLGLTLGTPLLQLIDTPKKLMTDSALYLRIYVLGLPFVFFYNIANGIFSALGDSRTPFLFLAASSLSNIGVDILFVKAFHMGVAGVAWATFLCQGVSCVLAMICVFVRLGGMKTTQRVRLFSARLLQRFVKIAVPATLQQSFVSVGNIVIQSVINGYGAGVIAGYAAAVKLNNLVITSFNTVGNGISNYAAQNLGAGETDRVKKGFWAGLRLLWTLAIPLSLLYIFAAEPLVRLFMDAPSATAVRTGVQFMHIVAPFYVVVCSKMAADGILRGAGCMGEFMVATFSDLLLRVVLAVLLSAWIGVVGIWSAWPVGWLLATVLSVLFYCRGKWKASVRT